MKDPIIITTLISAAVSIVTAIVTAFFTTRPQIEHAEIDMARALKEYAADVQRLWLWNRELVDHIYKQSPPPPPTPPEDLFKHGTFGGE